MRLDHKGREIFDLVCTNDQIVDVLRENFDWFSYLPDSIYKKVIPRLENIHIATRENHAIAMAFGARLGGKRPAVLIQNSGLGLSIDALLGLFKLFNQGLVLLVSNRGNLSWEEIQHQDWGAVTLPILDAVGIPTYAFDKLGVDAIRMAVNDAFTKDICVAVVIERGNIDE